MVHPRVPKQLCTFHKVQNIAGHLENSDLRDEILSEAHSTYEGLTTRRQALRRLAACKERREEVEPEAVRCFACEFEDTLTYLNQPPQWWEHLGTTNPIERVTREFNRKIRQVGICPNAQSLERTTYLVWRKLQRRGYGRTARQNAPIVFTPNS